MIWISLQDEGRMPWEREELMVSVTKEQSSFAHFLRTKGGIPRELSVEFDLMRDKSGRISLLDLRVLKLIDVIPRAGIASLESYLL